MGDFNLLQGLADIDPTGVLGSLFNATGLTSSGTSDALVAEMRKAAEKYDQYRPEAWAARMGSMNQALSMFEPARQQLINNYGVQVPELSSVFQYERGTPEPLPPPPPDAAPAPQPGPPPMNTQYIPGGPHVGFPWPNEPYGGGGPHLPPAGSGLAGGGAGGGGPHLPPAGSGLAGGGRRR